MKRNLKPYWLNLVFLLTVVAVSAIWLKGSTEETPETTTHSIDGRYHWAELERDVLIEIRNGEYTETQSHSFIRPVRGTQNAQGQVVSLPGLPPLS